MENVDRSRRTVVVALGAGALLALAAFLRRFVSPARAPERKALLVVEKRGVPARGALVYRESRLAVVRDGSRYYALGLVCTHLGCTVEVAAAGLVCPCHGSAFDRAGKVVRGPADRPLDRYEVEDRGERIAVLPRS